MATNNYALNCTSATENTGLSKLCQDIGTIVGYVIVPQGAYIDTVANANLYATWEAKIQAEKTERFYPFPPVFIFEDTSEEAVFQEGTISNLFVRDGKIMFDMTHESSRYKHAALKSHSNLKRSVYLIDQQGRIHGVSSDDIKFEPAELETFTVQKLKANNGTDASTTKVTMVFADSDKWQKKPAIIRPSAFNPKDLEGLTSVLLSESGTPTLSEIIIEVEVFRTGDSVLGFSETPNSDFVVKNATGVVQNPTTITDNGDGTYTFAFGTPLAAGTYTFDLLPTYSMSTKGYESLGPVTLALS